MVKRSVLEQINVGEKINHGGEFHSNDYNANGTHGIKTRGGT